MKLQELASPKAQNVAKVFESYFQTQLEVGRLDSRQTRQMLGRVRGLIQEHRNTTARHQSERNPAYIKLVMMEQALVARLEEMQPPVSTAQPATGQKPAQPNTAQPATGQKPAQPPVNPQDPKVKAALTKSQGGQTLTPDEQKLLAAVAQTTQEARLRRAFNMLKESEVQQAQVVLAAQDLVDSLQGMIEDATEMQYKELPALVGSIRDQVGVDQSNQFNTDATAALSGLVQSLQTAKQQMDAALGVVTGQAPAAPAVPGMPGAEAVPGAEAMPPVEEPPMELPPEEPAAASAGTLGRERR